MPQEGGERVPDYSPSQLKNTKNSNATTSPQHCPAKKDSESRTLLESASALRVRGNPAFSSCEARVPELPAAAVLVRCG